MSALAHFRFATAWLPQGWRRNVLVSIDAVGNIANVTCDDLASQAIDVPGAAIPGLPNVHSHAFQRAMAGLAERRASSSDSFWTWRETMYDLARRMTPECLNAIAAQLYVEMLKAGYTAVCEFHYLHNGPDGEAYAERAVMAQAIVDSAAASGIGLTLLPTLYQTADFGGVSPTQRQRQFVLGTGEFMALRESMQSYSSVQVTIGAALHSLRAVPITELRQVAGALAADCPIHIHVAEQEKEVTASVQHSGRRPVEWLFDNADVDSRWCLVHATHVTPDELTAVARSRAVVALCPTTEANLGDGLFPVAEFLASGGRIAIGSDSHIAIAPSEELRWLEYQARLARHERNVLATDGDSTGSALWRLAARNGAQACGRPIGTLQAGQRADIVVLDTQSPALIGRHDDALLDTFIFAAQPGMVRDVMVGGRWVVQDGHHFAEVPVAAGYRRAVVSLLR